MTLLKYFTMEKTTITINRDTWKKLNLLKINKGDSSIEKTIKALVEENEK